MSDQMTRDIWRVALAQVDPTVGDFAGNVRLVRDYARRAAELGAHIIAFPELVITGYPPEDLLLKVSFIEAARRALFQLVDTVPDRVLIVGVPWAEGGMLYNSAAVLARGDIVAVVPKHHLPTYGVFDEDRYFARGTETVRFLWGNLRFGV
ncbi:MAG: nitrilase-related carbon-nitrogen hydrolase, partial [Thermomicrobium sp.]|nr:NAD+ synthase [Thermomicrobium sp.]MDW8007280.1 nitrilase-related carbon-nitrogen hydrolase [Thermomicrobium sp.]